MSREAMKLALEALEEITDEVFSPYDNKLGKAITALREALAEQPAQQEPDAYGYASRLAVAIWEQHYKDVAPQWKPLDDLMGVLTQIDNMTSGLTRLAQPEQEQYMTKLEAWKAWCDTTGTGDLLANQFTLDNSSHGKAFSYAWNAALDDTATKIAAMPADG